MGFLDDRWAETARLLGVLLEPQLQPGEPLIGAMHATQSKAFSNQMYVVGVTPQRLIVLPVNRKSEPSGEPHSMARTDITSSSVWGWGGSVSDFLSSSADQQIRVATAEHKYKWMIVGGNILENTVAGDEHLRGLDALIEFLLSAPGGR